jgi:acyl CoA:acetate/3-ketoacid CoA transferase
MDVAGGKLRIDKEGKVRKLVKALDQVSFSGRRGKEQGQEVTYVTERCVLKLARDGIVVTEIAPGVELQANILDQSEFPLIVSPHLKEMDARLFHTATMGLKLHD